MLLFYTNMTMYISHFSSRIYPEVEVVKEKFLTDEIVRSFEEYLKKEEKSQNTVQKYVRDVKKFSDFLDGNAVTKQLVIAFKEHLLNIGYAARSVNSMLASVNSLFLFLGGTVAMRSLSESKRISTALKKKSLQNLSMFACVEWQKRTAAKDLN